MNANELIGLTIRGSTQDGGPHTRKISEVRFNQEFGKWVAWSVDAHGHGEHLMANTEEGLVRRVMSLR